ncbi:MAG: nucleotidyltransferase domain-containing protein [Planctomycetes bacterium]|nr:nucleotidyltransferase domain-containing protein [Planctomycetota bacterium]
MFDQEVLTALRGWAAILPKPDIVGAYVFGSLVNANGRAFSRASSDIDLLLVTEESEPSEKLGVLKKLVPHADRLEGLLRGALCRNEGEPITSVTLVTKFELDQGIHKERNSRIFFASNVFLPLTHETETTVRVGNALADDLLTEYFPAWTVIANAQGQRNKFLRKGIPSGRGLRVFDSPVYVLPKDLLRNAYAANCLIKHRDPAYGDVDDTAEGLTFIRSELEVRSKQSAEAAELLHLIESNRPGGRGAPRSVSAELLLYVWEVISSCAQSAVMHLRAAPALRKNRFAAPDVAKELVHYQATHLACVGAAIELYRGADLVSNPTIPVIATHRYRPDLHEFTGLDTKELELLVSEWPRQVQEHLRGRFGKEGSERSECKVGFARLDYSARGVGDPPVLSIRPLTYWVTRHFNKEIAIHKGGYQARMRAEYLERLLCSAEDYQCACPSALYVELAVITADRRIPVLFKATRHSVLGVGAGREIRTCGPEFGFVWAKHVAEVDGAYQLRVEQAIHDALFDEFKVEPGEIDSWQIGSLAIQSPHLNAALLGVVTLTLSETVLRQRLAHAKYHSEVERSLSKDQLIDRVRSDFDKGLWHATGLLRLTLATQFLEAVPH